VAIIKPLCFSKSSDPGQTSRGIRACAGRVDNRWGPGSLNPLVESTVIKFLGDGEWLARARTAAVVDANIASSTQLFDPTV